jgi:polar amino acid transport system permease protein
MVFDWQYALEILPELLNGFWITLQATWWGMLLALLLGLGWALLRRSALCGVALISGWIIEFIRSTPLLVQLYFLFFVLPDFGLILSPFLTGVLGLGLHYSTYTAEVYRAGIEGVPKGQWEAAMALNMTRSHTWKAIILPQAIPPVIPALGNYLVAMLKETPLLAAITVMELLQAAKLAGAETFRYLEPLTLVGVLFLAVSLLFSQFIRKLEAHFVYQQTP